MTRAALTIGGLVLIIGARAWATPPGPGAPFDCSAGGTTSCASDDTGCVPDTKDHLKCADGIAKAFGKAIRAVIKCHKKQVVDRTKGVPASSTGPAEDLCSEGPNGGKSAKEKLDAAIAKVAPLCSATELALAAA